MFYDNFIKACEMRGQKPNPVAMACGGSSASANSWKNGGSPNSNIVVKIAKYLNVSTDFLLFGEEHTQTPFSDEEKQIITEYRYLSDESKLDIRNSLSHLYDIEVSTELSLPTRSIKHSTFKVSAGVGEWMEDKSDINQWDSINIPDTPQSRKADYALTIRGNSMLPNFEDGDIILVKQQDAVDIGQICIYTVEGNGYIKKFGGDRLISLNDKFDDIIFKNYQNIRCNGLVIGKV